MDLLGKTWLNNLILIVSYVTASFTKVINIRRDHVPQKEGLKLEGDSLSVPKPFLELPVVGESIYSENKVVRENNNEHASLNNLYKIYEKDIVEHILSLRNLKRVKRQYNAQVYGDIFKGYSDYQNNYMENYLPAEMPNYLSHRQGKQLIVPEEESIYGNLYLPADMPIYFKNRQRKRLAVPEQPTSGNFYFPAEMPSYFSNKQEKQMEIPQPVFTSHRQGKQLIVPEEESISGNLYLPADMPIYFKNRQRKSLAVPEQPTSGNFYLPAEMPSNKQEKQMEIPQPVFTSLRQGKQLIVIIPTEMSSNKQEKHLAVPEQPQPVFTSGNIDSKNPFNHSVQNKLENDYLSPAIQYDYTPKLDEGTLMNFQDSFDLVAKSNENVPLFSQNYQDYYEIQGNENPISNDYYGEYMTYQDFVSNYTNDKQFDKDILEDKPKLNLTTGKEDTNSQGFTKQNNSETMDENTQIVSPLAESNLDGYVAKVNGDLPLPSEDYIGFAADELEKELADVLEDDKKEKDNGDKSEYEHVDSSENEESRLTKSDNKEDDSIENSVTRKGGARVLSIDPEGLISDTGLGINDVKRLIHQVTDIKDGRNLAFIQKFEDLISRMLN